MITMSVKCCECSGKGQEEDFVSFLLLCFLNVSLEESYTRACRLKCIAFQMLVLVFGPNNHGTCLNAHFYEHLSMIASIPDRSELLMIYKHRSIQEFLCTIIIIMRINLPQMFPDSFFLNHVIALREPSFVFKHGINCRLKSGMCCCEYWRERGMKGRIP